MILFWNFNTSSIHKDLLSTCLEKLEVHLTRCHQAALPWGKTTEMMRGLGPNFWCRRVWALCHLHGKRPQLGTTVQPCTTQLKSTLQWVLLNNFPKISLFGLHLQLCCICSFGINVAQHDVLSVPQWWQMTQIRVWSYLECSKSCVKLASATSKPKTARPAAAAKVSWCHPGTAFME